MSTSATTPAAGPSGTALVSRGRSGELASSQGTTTTADTVVSKIAGTATREVNGVHAVGRGSARAMGSLRERIPGGSVDHSQGISVEVGATEAAVDVDLVAGYGVAITDLAASVRRNVVGAVQRMTGLQVTEVTIAVNDVFIPSQDGATSEDGHTVSRQTRIR